MDAASTRRAFLKGGAILAPFAAAPAAMAADGRDARIARLEDEAAIRDLHQSFLRRINTGARDAALALFADPKRAAFDTAVTAMAADHAGAEDALDVADGTAAARFHCVVQIETPLAKDSTAALMAHAQGHGFVRTAHRRVLEASYVKTAQGWRIETAELV